MSNAIRSNSLFLRSGELDDCEIMGVMETTGMSVPLWQFNYEKLPYSCGQMEVGDFTRVNKISLTLTEQDKVRLEGGWKSLALSDNCGLIFASFFRHPRQRVINQEGLMNLMLDTGWEPLQEFVNPNTGNRIWTLMFRAV